MKTYSLCQFLLVFMTMMHTYIDYNGKICCSFVIFVILGADSQIFFFNLRFSVATHSNQLFNGFSQRGFAKYLPNYPTSGHKLNFFCLQTVTKIVLEVLQGVQPQYCDLFLNTKIRHIAFIRFHSHVTLLH